MLRFLSKHLLIIVMAAACALLVVFSPEFLLAGNLTNVARRVSAIAVMASGEMLVILTGGIDLSVGSVAALGQMVSGKAIKDWNFPIAVGFALGTATGAVCGLINGLLVTKGRIPSFIVTLGMMLAARGAALGLTDGMRISGFSSEFKWLGGADNWGVPFITTILIVLVLTVVLVYTRFGREIYAVGGNLTGARLSGINVDRVRIGAYTLCGTLAAFGGIMLASRSGVCDPTSADGLELSAIAACVVGGASLLGGEGSAIGALLGALVIMVLVNICQLQGMENEVQRIVIGVLIVVLVFIDNLRKRRAGRLST